MSLELQGVLYLIAVVLFVVAAFAAYTGHKAAIALVAAGLAVAYFVPMWNAFDAS